MDVNSKTSELIIGKKIESYYEKIDNPFDRSLPVNGCSVAIHRSIVENFPKPIKDLASEDQVLHFRAQLLNGGIYISDALLNYRVSNSSIYASSRIPSTSAPDLIAHHLKWTKDYIERMKQVTIDIHYSDKPDEIKNRIFWQAIKNKNNAEKKLAMLNGKFLRSFLSLFRIIVFSRESIKAKEIASKIFAIKWLPNILIAKRHYFNRTNF